MHYIVRLRARHLRTFSVISEKRVNRKQEEIECPDCWITKKTERKSNWNFEHYVGLFNTRLIMILR